MHVVSQEDIHEASDATDSDEEITASRPTQRRGSESSIGDFAEGDDGSAHSAHLEEEDSDEETKNRLLHHVAAATQAATSPVAAAPEAMDVDEANDGSEEEEHYSEDDIPAKTHVTPRRPASPPTFGSNRSFTRLDASSPVLEDLPGDIALREAIREDAAPILDGPVGGDLPATQVNVRAPISPISAKASSQARDSSLTAAPESESDSGSESESEKDGDSGEDEDDSSDSDEEEYAESKSPTPPPPKRRGPPSKNTAALPASQPVRRSARQLSREPEAPASQPARRTRLSSPQRVTRSSNNAAPVPTSQRVTRSSPQAKAMRALGKSVEEESDEDEETPRPSQVSSTISMKLTTAT
jgi:hypothetical protein